MLSLENVNTYYGYSHILQGVSLEVRQGEIVVLLGRNGVGKTTTMKTVMGIQPPKTGKDSLPGREYRRLAALQDRAKGHFPDP